MGGEKSVCGGPGSSSHLGMVPIPAVCKVMPAIANIISWASMVSRRTRRGSSVSTTHNTQGRVR